MLPSIFYSEGLRIVLFGKYGVLLYVPCILAEVLVDGIEYP